MKKLIFKLLLVFTLLMLVSASVGMAAPGGDRYDRYHDQWHHQGHHPGYQWNHPGYQWNWWPWGWNWGWNYWGYLVALKEL